MASYFTSTQRLCYVCFKKSAVVYDEKLKQLLRRGTSSKTFSEDIVWLQSFQAWINFHCPTLQTHKEQKRKTLFNKGTQKS